MPRTAYIRENTVMEILQPLDGHALDECYCKDFLDQCETVEDAVQPGWVRDGKTFVAPAPSTDKGK